MADYKEIVRYLNEYILSGGDYAIDEPIFSRIAIYSLGGKRMMSFFAYEYLDLLPPACEGISAVYMGQHIRLIRDGEEVLKSILEEEEE